MRLGLAIAVAAAVLLAACGRVTAPGGADSANPQPSPSPVSGAVAVKYDLIARFGPPAFCDPDLYPIAHEVTDAEIHQRLLTAMQADPATYQGILAHHGFGGVLTVAQERVVYQDYKTLTHIQLTAQGSGSYQFVYAARNGQVGTEATSYRGTVDAGGTITVQSQAPVRIMCPICLARGALIATPGGLVPVQSVRVGMLVYTADAAGRRLVEPVVAVGSAQTPPWHQIEEVDLSDGRVLEASPGHPTADGRWLEQLAVGDVLDGARVARLSLLPYAAGRTYDLLPAGPTGDYWADGVLIGSTLRPTLEG